MKNTSLEITTTRVWAAVLHALLVTSAILTVDMTSSAQSFNSGSDGSDGALTLTTPGTIVFDPLDKARFGRVLDPDGDGVYNFTTITIGPEVTVDFRGGRINRPVYWLASGNVVIDGTIDLRGGNGPPDTNDFDVRRQVAVPGPGGYAGGAGGTEGSAGDALGPTPGEGPGGGSFFPQCGPGAAFRCGKGGVFAGNRFLVPLVGGSGGGGSTCCGNTTFGAGGGAGGGAIMIASSTSITINGQMIAAGGQGGFVAGGGSGGTIRLVAPTVSGSGRFFVFGGGHDPGGSGWVRLEAYQLGTSFVFSPPANAVTRGAPGHPSTLAPSGSIRVTAIDGIPVSANPSGSFQFPDVTINKTGPVNVDIQASGVPPGTVVTLQVFPETPTDASIVNLPTAQATLTGTLQSSTATVTFTFPFGFSRGFVRASWTP